MAKRLILPSQAHLQECFDYSPETGSLRWRVRPISHFANKASWWRWNKQFADKEAGCTTFHNKYGTEPYYFKIVCLDLKMYVVARLIMRLVYDLDPERVDHINRNGLDNRLSNLRACTASENRMNCRRKTRNKTGFKGVTMVQRHTTAYVASITLNKKTVHLGYFYTPEDAHKAYCDAAKKHFGEFACFN